MENPGLVRDELDRKILILYVLRRLPAPIDSELLYEVCLCDNGLQYFDYSQSLQDLVDSGHVAEEDDEYVITEKGIRNADAVCTSLPFSVRNAADKMTSTITFSVIQWYISIQLTTASYHKKSLMRK